MSYDLVLWRGAAHESPSSTWARLADGAAVEGIAPFEAGEVRDAFRQLFGAEVKLDQDGTLLGPGFELRVRDGDAYLQVCCAWGLLKSEAGRGVLGRVRRVADELHATVFDPQTAEAPRDAPLRAVSAELARLGEPRSVTHCRPDEDRAQSFARVELWRVTGPEEGRGGIHSLYLRESGSGTALRHAYHPRQLIDIVCDYARLVQEVLPFDVLVASGHGRAQGGTTVTFGTRLLAVVDGRAGFLGSPSNPIVQEDGETISRWTHVQFSPTGPLASRRGPAVDLTAVVERAARDALRRAHDGQTRALRDWIVLMASIHSEGLAAEELLASEVPPGADTSSSFELSDSGASMPVWSQRSYGAFRLEARLRLPDSGGFVLRLLTRDRQAPPRHRLDPPLGPSV